MIWQLAFLLTFVWQGISNLVSLFLLGREYCYLKPEAERNASKWVIGENDIIFITRTLGIVNIEVKGNIIIHFFTDFFHFEINSPPSTFPSP